MHVVMINLSEEHFKELQELKKDLDLDDSLAIAAAVKDMLYTDISFSAMEYGKHQWQNGKYEYNYFYYRNQDEFDSNCNCHHCSWNKIESECKHCGFKTTKNKLKYCGPNDTCFGKRICPNCHQDFYIKEKEDNK